MAIATSVPYQPVSTRRLQDAGFSNYVACPAASATTNTAWFDLMQPQYQSGQVPAGPNTYSIPGAFPVTEAFWVNIVLGASAQTTNNKNINVYLEHTAALTTGAADTANAANVSGYTLTPVLRAQDNNGGGTTAQSCNIILPPTTKRFIRCKCALEADGNTAADANVTVKLLF